MTPEERRLLAAGAANWIYPYLGGQVPRETTVDRIIEAFGTVQPVSIAAVEGLISNFNRAHLAGRHLMETGDVGTEQVPTRPDIANQWQYTAVVTVQDTEGEGQRSTIPVVIVSDEQLSMDRIQELATEAVFNESDSEGPGRFVEVTLQAAMGDDIIVTDVRVTEVWRRQGRR